MDIQEVLLLGFMVGLAYWRRELILYLAAAAGAGMLSVIWWEVDVAYGVPALLLSGIMVWKFAYQLISGKARF